MIHSNLILLDGTILTKGFNRVVHGQRGDYVEFEVDHLCIPLKSKFNNTKLDMTNPLDIYYYWLTPIHNSNIKIYLQLKTVKYADYKIGKYYISPDLLKDFKDPEKLF